MPTALVVDDDPDLRLLMVSVLGRAGYELWTAADGEDALATAVARRPDVVLLDWLLPGRSGIEVCRSLREDPALTRTAVVLVSARGTESDREWGFSCGADDYLVKPFSPADLLSRVDQAVARRRQPS